MNFFANNLQLRFAVIFTISLTIVFAALTFVNKNYGKQIEKAELELTFKTIQAGPMEYARSYSTDIANKHLKRILNTSEFQSRGFVGGSIYSGPSFKEQLAHWQHKKVQKLDKECILEKSHISSKPSDFFPFKIVLYINNCDRTTLTDKLQKATAWTLTLAFLVVMTSSVIFYRPVMQSIEMAEKALTGTIEPENVDKIWYPPVKRLAIRAIEAQRIKEYKSLHNLAKKVAHNIRSPLSALTMITKSSNGLASKERELLINVSDRISRIANELLNNNKVPQEGAVEINKLLSELIAEKVIEFGSNIEIEYPNCQNTKALIDSTTLQSIVSNILNNSKEAGANLIKVSVRSGDQVEITFKDNGMGASSEKLQKIGDEGYTTKENGNGIGIFSARQALEKSGGKIHLSSILGESMTITLKIPLA